MTNRQSGAVLIVAMLAGVLAACSSGIASLPTSPSSPSPPTQPPPVSAPPDFSIADVTLSGLVFEMTPTGRVPVTDARVFLSDNQDISTDANGFFSFRPVPLCPCRYKPGVKAGDAVISVSKDGYGDPAGQPPVPGYNGPSWRVVTIDGDTRFDVELVRR